MLLSARYRFSAAMRLDGYEGPCGVDHGYEFVLDVAVRVPDEDVRDGAMPLDFVTLDALVEQRVVTRLHRSHLSTLLPNPTLERLALWIREQLQGHIAGLDHVQVCAGDRYSVHLRAAAERDA